jgi:hypothetical protein
MTKRLCPSTPTYLAPSNASMPRTTGSALNRRRNQIPGARSFQRGFQPIKSTGPRATRVKFHMAGDSPRTPVSQSIG